MPLQSAPQGAPRYASHRPNDDRSNAPKIGVRVVRSLDELMKIFAIRSAVYMADQMCPYEEEFDGNDFSATHLLGFHGKEPAGCIRARFFADFVKLERLAVRREYRHTRLAFQLVRAGMELARKKGFTRIYGHAQDRLIDFWAHFGAKPLGPDRTLVFSDFSYTEMVIEMEPHPDPIKLGTDPYTIIRPEGEWHVPGPLDNSALRPVTSPINGMQQERNAA